MLNTALHFAVENWVALSLGAVCILMLVFGGVLIGREARDHVRLKNKVGPHIHPSEFQK